MSDKKDSCIICEKPINSSTSPSSTASVGPYHICDSCADKFGKSSSTSDTKGK